MNVKKNESQTFPEAVAKSTEAKLKEKYEEEEIEEVAKILRKPLRITGGITGRNGEIGFWSAKEVIPRVFSKLLDEDFNINDYYDLIRYAESKEFKDTLAQDYLETYEYFERNWELIEDPEIKV